MTTSRLSNPVILKLVTATLIFSLAAPSLAEEAHEPQKPEGEIQAPNLPEPAPPWSVPSGTEINSPKLFPSDKETLDKLDGQTANSPYAGAWAVGGAGLVYFNTVSLIFSGLRQWPALREAEGNLSRFQRLRTPEDLAKEISALEARRDLLKIQVGFVTDNPIPVPPGGTIDTVTNAVPGLPSARKQSENALVRKATAATELKQVEEKLAILTRDFSAGSTAHNKQMLQQALAKRVERQAAGEDLTVTVSSDFKKSLIDEAKIALRTLRMQRLREGIRASFFRKGAWNKHSVTVTETSGVETGTNVLSKEMLIQAGTEGRQFGLWTVRSAGAVLRIALVIQGARLIWDWYDDQPIPRLRSGERVQVQGEPAPAPADAPADAKDKKTP